MSGYFDRLVSRAQGGSALAGLVLVKPIASIYAGREPYETKNGPGLGNYFETENFAAKKGLEPIASPQPVREPSGFGATQQATQHVIAEPAALDQPNNNAKPDLHTRPLISAEKQKDALPSQTDVHRSNGNRPNSSQFGCDQSGRTDRITLSEQDFDDNRPQNQQMGYPGREEPEIEDATTLPPEAAPPSTAEKFMPKDDRLERLFEAIEDESKPYPIANGNPYADSAASTPRTNSPGANEIPAVSIGRIEISIAPPVRPPQPQRTQGFQSYARLRRGLER